MAVRQQINPDLRQEYLLWQAGYSMVGGIDEAGRGCWAGPVFAAVVVLSPTVSNASLLEGIRDSKQMTARQRQKWSPIIKEVCLDWGVGRSSNVEIDRYGIVKATHLAARRALKQLKTTPDFLLLDYIKIKNIDIPQRSFIRGDQQILSISAASIIAKTSRDALMIVMDRLYPEYFFNNNKGYGTAAHHAALQQEGVCPIHRLSFKPVSECKNALERALSQNK